MSQPKPTRYVGLAGQVKDWIVLADTGPVQLIFFVELIFTSDLPGAVIDSRSSSFEIP